MSVIFGSPHYNEDLYAPRRLRAVVNRVVKKIVVLKKKLRFQAIAFTGSSGAAIAYAVSAATGIPLIHVRAKGTKSHGDAIEGSDKRVERYVILDDMIASGATVRRVYTNVQRLASRSWNTIECVGVLLYADNIERPTPFNITAGRNLPVFSV